MIYLADEWVDYTHHFQCVRSSICQEAQSLSLPCSNSFCILFLETQDLAAIQLAHQKNSQFSEMSYPS